MSDKKYSYRVKPGHKWGPFNQYGPGSVVDLTVEEAEGFLDKLELVNGKHNELPAEIPGGDIDQEEAYLLTLTAAQLKGLPEWANVEPPRPTSKPKIVEAILTVRRTRVEA